MGKEVWKKAPTIRRVRDENSIILQFQKPRSVYVPGLSPPGPPYKEYNYPPVWKCVIAGIVSAPLSFFVVLYSLRGMTRGTRWFAVWIIEGFRDEKKELSDKQIKK